MQNFLQILDDMNISLACVCESWFDSKEGLFSKMIKDSGFKLHHAYREKKRAGGVAILYKIHLSVKEGDSSTSLYLSFEFTCITLQTQSKKKIVVACIYRKQEVPFITFTEEFSIFIEKLVFRGDALMLVGDFNVWVDIEDDEKGKQLLTLMQSYGMNQLIREQTHRGGHTLDQLYVNEFQLQVKYKVIDDNMGLTTDHLPLLLELPSCSNLQKKNNTILCRKVKNVVVDDFRKDLEEAYSSMFDNDENFLQMSTRFHNISSSVVDKHSPIIKIKRTTNQPPWIDQEYKNNRTLRRKYEREWKKNRSDENKKKYIDQKNKCAMLVVEKQTSYYSKMIQDAGTCQKTLFKIANELLDKSKEKILPSYSNSKELADDFNKFYINKVNKIRSSIPIIDEIPPYYARQFNGDRMNYFSPVSEEDVKKIIQLKGIKTSMEDPIPSQLMQSSIDIILPIITRLINKSLEEGSMDGIKESILDPLLKKAGLDTEEYKNYRPVNHLLYLSKLIERCVDEQIESHMTKNCLHENSQYAYKKHHNTEMMMLSLTDEVLRGFDDDQATVIIFLDLSAAFDTIDVDKLLQIMHDEIGLGGTVLEWFGSFLKGRTQRVKIEDSYSESEEVPCGAPQGSILGPKCFNINVRSQPRAFERWKLKSSSFADDSNGRKKFALKFQFNVITQDIVECLKEIVKWSNVHYMKLNPDKTEIILLCPSSLNKEVIIRGVIYEDECIRFSTEVKNVGVWLDKNLKMDKHVNSITSHCYKILKDIGRIRKYLQKNHIENLVHAVISSRLDYCNSMFMNISKDNLFKLQKLQNAAARLVLGRRKRDSGSQALKQLHWLNVDSRVVFKLLLLVFKMLKGLSTQNLGLRYKSFNGRSDDFLLLYTPIFKTIYGTRIFEYNGSRLWNALPTNVRSIDNVNEFKKVVKTTLFEGCQSFKQKAYKYRQ